MSGLVLFSDAERSYAQNNITKAFEYYLKAIKKILKDENVVAVVPASMLPPTLPADMPRELLGMIWRNWLGFFRDGAMNWTQETAPEAYKFLTSFKPSSSNSHKRLEATTAGKLYLKGMQVTAGLTLGLMAWDKGDRATASKRYYEAIELAATHPGFTSADTVGWEHYVYQDILQTKDNLRILLDNDTTHASMTGANAKRRDVANLPIPMAKIDKKGNVIPEASVMFASDGCAKCGTRGVKLSKCSRCKSIEYCGAECQKKHWKAHKVSCTPH